MTERKVRVSSDTWVSEAAPNRARGRHRELRVRAGAGDELQALLWARTPWDAQETVFVQSQTLRLTVAEDTAAGAELYVRAVSRRFNEHNVTWNRKPSVTGPTATKTVGVLAAGDTVDIDITAIGQNVAGGQRNKGLRLSTDSTTRIRFHSSESRHRPVIITEWADEPSAPTIKPAGLVSRQFPAFGFPFEEADGDLSAVRLQIDPAADGVTPDFDSGLVPATEALYDTTGSAYLGLADMAATKVRGSIVVSGIESPMSDWVTITRRAKGTLTPVSPAAGVVNSPTPTLLADFTSPNGETLTEQRIRVYNAARTRLLYDSGRGPSVDGDTIADTVPRRWKGKRVLRRKGLTYSARFDAWGDAARVNGPGDPSATTTWADFTVEHAAITTPTGFTATVPDGAPWADLAFTIGIVPDEVAIAIDDDIVAILDATTIHAGGTSYAYRLAALSPYRDAEVKVAQIVDGQMSPWSTPATVQTQPLRVWVVDETNGRYFQLWDVDPENWEITDQGAYYDPIGAPHMVKIVTSLQGMRGELVGTLRDETGLPLDQQLTDLWAIKADLNQTDLRLVTGLWSLAVALDDLGAGPSRQHRSGQHRALAKVKFRQVDDLPYDAVV